MKPLFLRVLAGLTLAACGGSPAGVGVTTPSNAAVAAPVQQSADRSAAAAPPAAPVKATESLDPLAVGGDLDAAMVPTVVMTPAKELRGKSRGDLDSAMALLKNESTPEGAAKKVTARLGKPTWIESGKKRVWIAKDGKSCHRFVLDNDGQADVETASMTEWRILTASAKQSPCTGEIKRGGLSD